MKLESIGLIFAVSIFLSAIIGFLLGFILGLDVRKTKKGKENDDTSAGG